MQVLHMLAVSPVTAHHVSLQIAQRFVSDNPPPALVDAMAATWVKTGGDIREVLRTMLESPQFWSQDAYRAKVKTPEEYVISAVRATGGEVVHPAALVEAIGQLGMPLYGCQTPNGYSWMADAWLNSGELLDRMNFSLALADNNAGTVMGWDKLMSIEGQAGVTADAKEGKLENLLLDGVVSEQTRSAVLAQLAQQQGTPGEREQRPQMTEAGEFRAAARVWAAVAVGGAVASAGGSGCGVAGRTAAGVAGFPAAVKFAWVIRRAKRTGAGSSRLSIDAWFAAMDRFNGGHFHGRGTPATAGAFRRCLLDLNEMRETKVSKNEKTVPQGLKPIFIWAFCGTTEVVP